VEEIEAERIDPYACELRDLAAAVAGERAPLLGRADAAGQARAIAALYRSAENGQMVRP
jgi:D-xylose 1-dehydrogenase (NADP+, D-xylono-1,5-lactone-forming)